VVKRKGRKGWEEREGKGEGAEGGEGMKRGWRAGLVQGPPSS